VGDFRGHDSAVVGEVIMHQRIDQPKCMLVLNVFDETPDEFLVLSGDTDARSLVLSPSTTGPPGRICTVCS
jgi:hypothetical protein